jgi:hypothetical protein
MTYLAICAIVRDEAPYIREWIEFHRLVGVEQFYIYDDGSTDDTVEILHSIEHGDIAIRPWGFGHTEFRCREECTYRDTPQITAFNHCVHNYHHECRWCAFVDVDEYLYHATKDNLAEALYDYEDVDALAIHWLTFGTSGHLTMPPGLTIENYTHRGPVGGCDQWGKNVKIIANMRRIKTWGRHGSHNADFIEGSRGCINENRDPTPLGSVHDRPATNRSWRLNHYFTRSEAEFAVKRAKEDHNAVPMRSPDMDWIHNQNDEIDTDIQRFVPALKQRLRL